ncbi:MAG: hypothetical protein KDK35_21080 [Leptospiraceae bacterium]|nr:hypothetical protein [Leptospiraceae bacterium]
MKKERTIVAPALVFAFLLAGVSCATGRGCNGQAAENGEPPREVQLERDSNLQPEESPGERSYREARERERVRELPRDDLRDQ